jgi:hypothetical protein
MQSQLGRNRKRRKSQENALNVPGAQGAHWRHPARIVTEHAGDSGDLFEEGFGVGERTPDEHARPAEMARRLVCGLGFLVHDDHFPHSDPMSGQVRLAH